MGATGWAKDLTLALWLRKLGFILCAHSIKIQNRKITIISNNLKSSAPWRWLKASENSHGIYAVTLGKCLRDWLNVWYIYSNFCINRMNIFRKVQSPPSSRTFNVLSSWGSIDLKLLHLCQRHLSNGSDIYQIFQTCLRHFQNFLVVHLRPDFQACFILKQLLWGPKRSKICNFCYTWPWPTLLWAGYYR